MSARAPDEATLHAWVDGELAPDAAAAPLAAPGP